MQLHLDTNQKELKSHGTWEFPVHVVEEQLSRYERKSFLWHWHKEIELTLLLQGEMFYQINENVYHLKAGDGLFCNSNMLHTGYACEDHDCIYISTTFHPRFLYGYENSILHTKYVEALTGDPLLSGFALSPSVDWQKRILDHLQSVWEKTCHPTPGYELQLHLALEQIWLELWEHRLQEPPAQMSKGQKNMDRLKKILTFIQKHYTEKITLTDIAGEVNICQSECCRFFKKHMNESLFDYLLSYRIEQSLPLLTEGRLSVTEIADRVGFSSPSYYSKVFRAKMNCTPSQYQNL